MATQHIRVLFQILAGSLVGILLVAGCSGDGAICEVDCEEGWVCDPDTGTCIPETTPDCRIDEDCDEDACELCVADACVYSCLPDEVCDGAGNCIAPPCSPACEEDECEECIDGECVFLCAEDEYCDGASSCIPEPLTIVSTTPDANEMGVPLDRPIRVLFSAPLAPDMPLAAVWIRDAVGAAPNGQWEMQGHSVVFRPAMLIPLETYTITVSTAVGTGRVNLEEEYNFTFTTGETASSGRRPPNRHDSPLGPALTVNRRPEYVIVWTTEKSTNVHDTYTDGAARIAVADPNPNYNAPAEERLFENWFTQGSNKIPVSGQFDDDGWEEVMVVEHMAGNVTVRMLDTTGINTFARRDTPGVVPSLDIPAGQTITAVAAVAADFNQNGRDELAVFMLGSAPAYPLIYRTIGFDPVSQSYQIVASGEVAQPEGLTLYTSSSSAPVEIHAAAGPVHEDGIPRAVVVWSGRTSETDRNFNVGMQVFDSLHADMAPLGNARKLFQVHGDYWNRCPDPTVSLVTADGDGNGRHEIFIGATEHWWQQSSLTGHRCNSQDVMRYINSTDADGNAWEKPVVGGDVAGNWVNIHTWHNWYDNAWMGHDRTMRRPFGLMVAGRFLGDPNRQEVVFNNRVYRFKSDMTHETGWPALLNEEVFKYEPGAHNDWKPGDLSIDYLTRDAAVADMNQNGRDDLVLLRKSSPKAEADGITPGFYVTHVRMNGVSGGVVQVTQNDEQLANGANYKNVAGSPRLALANVDADSTMVMLESTSAVLSDPRIVAVLAVPPYRLGIDQNIDDCSTDFAQGSGTGWSNGTSTEKRLGITVGFEWEPNFNIGLVAGVSIKIASVEFELETGATFGYEHVWATELETEMGYGTGPYDNLVIAEVDVYQSYLYRIITDPDSTNIGKGLTVNIPLGHRRSALSQEFFNHAFPEFKIEAPILGSVPGDINSYPTLAEARALLEEHAPIVDIGAAVHLLEPPASAGATATWGYSVTHSESSEFSFGLYVDASLRACTPDASGMNPSVCAGVTAGTSIGYAHSRTWSSSTSFAGTIGGIPGQNWVDNLYNAGLFAYRVTIEPGDGPVSEGMPVPGKQQFVVVNYYVQ